MELHELKKRYVTLAETLPCAFFDLNPRGNVIYFNKRAESLLGTGEQLVGMKLAEKVSKRHLYTLLTIFREAVKKGRDRGEIEIKARGGEQTVGLEVVAVNARKGITGFQCYLKEGKLTENPLSRGGYEIALALVTTRIALNEASKRNQ